MRQSGNGNFKNMATDLFQVSKYIIPITCYDHVKTWKTYSFFNLFFYIAINQKEDEIQVHQYNRAA